jgi:GPI mannosyltransferase 3
VGAQHDVFPLEHAVSSTSSVSFLPRQEARVTFTRPALLLPAMLVAGFALRIGVSLARPHVLFFDETIQYFEQAHRLAFGSGIIPWEYIEGIRSWLLPALIAVVMKGSAWFSDNPMVYVDLVRALCAGFSLVVIVAAYGLAERRSGRTGGIVAGGFCVIWFDLIYFAPSVMTEVLAAHATILALYLGEVRRTSRRAYWVGVLAGMTICLRYQYAPPVLLALAWQWRRDRDVWAWLFMGVMSALLPFSGVLDAITWGRAFQSIWLNFRLNAGLGIASAIGTEGPLYYIDYLAVALTPFPLFLGLAAIGARRFPSLAIAAVVTVVVHSALPHKEVRFIYLAIAALPVLIGLGAVEVLSWLARRPGGERLALAGPMAFLGIAAACSCFIAAGPLVARWSFQRGTVHAFLAAHDAPGLCGLRVRDMPSWRSGGYTYLNRDVPLVFEPYVPEVHLPGVSLPLRFAVERDGGLVPQYRGAWSHMIAEIGHAPAGFTPIACFPGDVTANEPELCLYKRPEGCL